MPVQLVVPTFETSCASPDVTSSPCEERRWYPDADGDGAKIDPDISDEYVLSCTQPDGYVPFESLHDCDDSDASVYPFAPEICDGQSNDCDSFVDEEPINPLTWYYDNDGDHYAGADENHVIIACDLLDEDYSTIPADCDDRNPEINPEATEVCDGLDNDCDGIKDEENAAGSSLYFEDGDGDRYGNAEKPHRVCEAGLYVTNDDDCDDTDAHVYPNADQEFWDGKVNDCNKWGTAEPDQMSYYEDVSWILKGSNNTLLGAALASGDLTDDSNAELIVGSPQENWPNTHAGAVLLFSDLEDLEDESSPFNASSVAQTTFYGENTADKLGTAVAYLENAIENTDVTVSPATLVGAPGYDLDEDNRNAGAAYLISATALNSGVVSEPTWMVVGDDKDDSIGDVVADLGDIDGDGLDDLGVGSKTWDQSRGRVDFFLAPYDTGGAVSVVEADYHYEGENSGDATPGLSLASAGDINGDGRSDVAVGVTGMNDLQLGSGIVFVITDPENSKTLRETTQIWGWSIAERFGKSVAAMKDLDDDGRSELAACGVQFGGLCYVIPGSQLNGSMSPYNSLYMVALKGEDEELGFSVAAADTDGDFDDELLVGGPAFANDAGGIFVFDISGNEVRKTLDPGDARAYWYAESGDRLGETVSFMDNGDGFGCAALGMPSKSQVGVVENFLLNSAD